MRTEQARIALENKEGCMLQGAFQMERVSGNFHVSFHSYINSFLTLRNSHHDLWMKMNLSYEIVDLKFGHLIENMITPTVRQVLKDMDMDEQLFENYVDHKVRNYNNFIGAFWLELIPYTLIDHKTNFEFKSIQHSFNRKIKVLLIDDSSTRN